MNYKQLVSARYERDERKMNICVAVSPSMVGLWKNGMNEFQQCFPQVDICIVDHKDRIGPEVEVLIATMGLKPEDLEDKQQLQLLMVPFTGVNQLPLEFLNERGITLVNSHINAQYVAERGLALALALMGRVTELHEQFREGWNGMTDTSWTSLIRKKVGILGMGDIGRELALLLSPFHGEIVTLKRYEKRCDGLQNITFVESMEDIFLKSDILFNILPLTEQTRGIINRELLKKLKGKYFVNIGRGPVVEEEALYDLLSTGVIKGAALDVWYQYHDDPSRFPIHKLPNVVISPHCAGSSVECNPRNMEDTLENLENYLNGKGLRNVVKTSHGY